MTDDRLDSHAVAFINTPQEMGVGVVKVGVAPQNFFCLPSFQIL